MGTELIETPENPFERLKHTDGEREYWLARELQEHLGYTSWQMFKQVVTRAVKACKNSGSRPADHFNRAIKMIQIGKGGKRQVEDYEMTRYGCYLLAMNGDPFKQEVALAQTYFAARTRESEIMQERLVAIGAQEITMMVAQLASLQTDVRLLNEAAQKKGYEKALRELIGGADPRKMKWTPE